MFVAAIQQWSRSRTFYWRRGVSEKQDDEISALRWQEFWHVFTPSKSMMLITQQTGTDYFCYPISLDPVSWTSSPASFRHFFAPAHLILSRNTSKHAMGGWWDPVWVTMRWERRTCGNVRHLWQLATAKPLETHKPHRSKMTCRSLNFKMNMPSK